MNLFILTWCQDEETLYGNLLTAQTLRIGFPTANVTVVDNASIPSAREKIKQTYEREGCKFIQLDTEIPHHQFIGDVIAHYPGDNVAFLDPDLVFWGNMEELDYPGLLNGRLIPNFYDNFTRTKTVERLHTSLIVIPDLATLRAYLQKTRMHHFEAAYVAPTMIKMDGVWYRWDTMATMYGELKDFCHVFGEELDMYDHLFCGSNFHFIKHKIGVQELEQVHEEVKNGNVFLLKGVHKAHDAYFLKHKWS